MLRAYAVRVTIEVVKHPAADTPQMGCAVDRIGPPDWPRNDLSAAAAGALRQREPCRWPGCTFRDAVGTRPCPGASPHTRVPPANTGRNGLRGLGLEPSPPD